MHVLALIDTRRMYAAVMVVGLLNIRVPALLLWDVR